MVDELAGTTAETWVASTAATKDTTPVDERAGTSAVGMAAAKVGWTVAAWVDEMVVHWAACWAGMTVVCWVVRLAVKTALYLAVCSVVALDWPTAAVSVRGWAERSVDERVDVTAVEWVGATGAMSVAG